jgi:thiol-disulfide isomerase/thioredoxin
MLNKRHLLAGLALVAALAVSAPLGAMTKKPFDPKAFEAAQAAGQPILVEVSAPWCPTCRAQKPILANLATKPKFKGVAHFDIDFDTQKDLLRKFNVRSQSTLIAFKGKQEVGRSTGDTNAGSIERLLDKAL